jgi:dihydrofolate synthase/folylpolyglutamate synthase
VNYPDSVQFLYALGNEIRTAKLGLERIRAVLDALGRPQDRCRFVHVAGTNGKGSTCATLASILSEAGYRTGLYTSPHLSRVNERIRINGETISDKDFSERYFRVHDAAVVLVEQGKLPSLPSFFETLTAIAFVTCAEENAEIAVLEVGMGGRLDATNIVEPMVSVITDISLDHTEWLGSTVTAIAGEKAGILRQDGVLITVPQHPEANQAIGEHAMELHVRGVSATDYIPTHPAAGSRNQYPLEVLGTVIQVDSPLAGVHQQRNLALAIAAAVEIRNNHGYNIGAASIEAGIRATRWPGRLEQFPGHQLRADVLLDVAHNPAGVWALRSALPSLAPGSGLTLVFGCLRDKAVAEMAQILFPLFDRVILAQVDSPRAATLDEMSAAARVTGVRFCTAPDTQSALQTALEQTPVPGLVVACGSVYLVGKVRELIPVLDTQAEYARTIA